MRRHGRIQAVGRWDETFAGVALGLALLAGATAGPAAAQEGPAPAAPQPSPPATVPTVTRVPATSLPPFNPAPGSVVNPTPFATFPPPGPGNAVVGPVLAPEGTGSPAVQALAPNTQAVRFHGPAGLLVEVLAPAATPLAAPLGEGLGIATVGLERGVGYRLRLSNITERPGAELFPVIEVVGHLHRPREVDPAKYPIRVVFTDQDLWEVVDSGRLVTKVIYLEDPDLAVPIRLPKDQIPIIPIDPTEQPLRVASALGRVVAVVRIGGRRPSGEEIQGGATGDLGLDALAASGPGRCPFAGSAGEPCSLPCGPVCGTPPPPGRPWLPKDEYLCDGGDRGDRAGVGGDGGLRGIDPRDAVMKFDIGLTELRKDRILPTNRVCIYAPRFAEVRVSTGANAAVEVHGVAIRDQAQGFDVAAARTGPKRLVHNDAAMLARERRRASASIGRAFPAEGSDMRGPSGFDVSRHADEDSQAQPAELARQRAQPNLMKRRIKLDGLKVAESPLMTGLAEGPGQVVKTWTPTEMTGVETPPDRPGMAIVKRVNVAEAEPGDTLTFTITYRNMGNTPIRSAAIVDSLLPRLEYVKGSALGPKGGTVFTTAENRAGSTELKWQLPGVIAPGASGYVEFQAVVR